MPSFCPWQHEMMPLPWNQFCTHKPQSYPLEFWLLTPRENQAARIFWMMLSMVHFVLQRSGEKSHFSEGARTSKPGEKTDGFMSPVASRPGGAGPHRMPGAFEPFL